MNSLPRQTLIGCLLATGLIGAWLTLHIVALFWLDNAAHPLLALLLFVLLTWLSVGLFITGHDAMHGSLAPTRPRLNRILGTTAVVLYANLWMTHLYEQHHRHHDAPGGAGDPDFHAGAPTRFWPWYGRFMHRYFSWHELFYMVLRVGLYLALGAPLQNILLLYALPSILASLQLFMFGTWLPHRHHDDRFADGHNARTNGYGTFVSLLTCFHFGYHHEHHLQPGLPWWRLPQFYRGRRMDRAADL